MDKSLIKQLLVLIVKLLLLIMFFQVITLVGGLIIGNLLNEIYPALEFHNRQAFTASNVATISMIVGTFVMAWFMYKNNVKKLIATTIAILPVITVWMLVLLFYN